MLTSTSLNLKKAQILNWDTSMNKISTMLRGPWTTDLCSEVWNLYSGARCLPQHSSSCNRSLCLAGAAHLTWAALSQQHLSSARAEAFISPNLLLCCRSRRKRWQSASQSANSLARLSACNSEWPLWILLAALPHNHRIVTNLTPIRVLWNRKARLTARNSVFFSMQPSADTCPQNRKLMIQISVYFPLYHCSFFFFFFSQIEDMDVIQN